MSARPRPGTQARMVDTEFTALEIQNRQRSVGQYFQHLTSTIAREVTEGMGDDAWNALFGFSGSFIREQPGGGDNDPEDPDFHEKRKVYGICLANAKHRRYPSSFRFRPYDPPPNDCSEKENSNVEELVSAPPTNTNLGDRRRRNPHRSMSRKPQRLSSVTDDAGHVDDASENDGDATPSWSKGVGDPRSAAVNIWSLNGYGQPVFTGGMYQSDEIRTLEATVRDYCASNNVALGQLCGGEDYTAHNKLVRGAWQEIARCLPHRTVLSVYRRAKRQLHGRTRGAWSEEEVAALFRLVELHGQKWASIENKLGRTAVDCRVKFFDATAKFERGKWSTPGIALLLQEVRAALGVPRRDMDVREINQWTLERNSKIPWTAISYRVNRRRVDCYFKWKQLTKRSNRMALKLGLERTPMLRDSIKADLRTEYTRWKAEQDPHWRRKYAEDCLRPLLPREKSRADARREHVELLESLVASRATRASEVSWHALARGGGGEDAAPRDTWERLVDEHAAEGDLDLPLWTLARIVKGAVERAREDAATSEDEARETPSARARKAGEEGAARKTRSRRRPPSGSAGESIECQPRKATEKPRDGETARRNPTGEALKKNTKETSSPPHTAGVPVERLRNAIEGIVARADPDVTVGSVRKLLEVELGLDLSPHNLMLKEMIKEAL